MIDTHFGSLEFAKPDDFFPQLDAELFAHGPAASIDEHGDVTRRGASRVDDEVGVHGRDRSASFGATLETGPFNQRTGRQRHVRRQLVPRWIGILKDTSGTWQMQRLSALAKRQRLSRRFTQPG
jgi:hypothetical protein